VFGGTPNTARETHALPEIAVVQPDPPKTSKRNIRRQGREDSSHLHQHAVLLPAARRSEQLVRDFHPVHHDPPHALHHAARIAHFDVKGLPPKKRGGL